MMLSNEDIQEFKVLYKNHFGEDLSDDEALERATRLIELVRVVYTPIIKR
jgi:hypothetical protein